MSLNHYMHYSGSHIESGYSFYLGIVIPCVSIHCLPFFKSFYLLCSNEILVTFEIVLLLYIGYYTCVEVIFTLRRQVGFYMMGVYAPTLLIVVLSWLSFWINPDASAARVPLGKIPFTNSNIFHWYLDKNTVNNPGALLACVTSVKKWASGWGRVYLRNKVAFISVILY